MLCCAGNGKTATVKGACELFNTWLMFPDIIRPNYHLGTECSAETQLSQLLQGDDQYISELLEDDRAVRIVFAKLPKSPPQVLQAYAKSFPHRTHIAHNIAQDKMIFLC